MHRIFLPFLLLIFLPCGLYAQDKVAPHLENPSKTAKSPSANLWKRLNPDFLQYHDKSETKIERISSELLCATDSLGALIRSKTALCSENPRFAVPQLSMTATQPADHLQNIDQQIRALTGHTNTFGALTKQLKVMNNTEFSKYKKALQDPSQVDRTIDQEVMKMEEYQSFQKQAGELNKLKGIQNDMMHDLEKYSDVDGNPSQWKAMAKEEAIMRAQDYLAGHMEALSTARGQLTKLKKKYSFVPGSKDLSKAVKTHSLKEEPFKKRIRLGGQFQFHQGNPFSMDLSPAIFYRINKVFSVGVSGTYRVQLGMEDKFNTTVTQDVYGCSGQLQHLVWKGFFGHAEFQYMSSPVETAQPKTDAENRFWKEGLPIGIGKQIKLSSGINGQVIFTYDVLHTADSPNPKAWNIKFGFMIGKLNLKKLGI